MANKTSVKLDLKQPQKAPAAAVSTKAPQQPAAATPSKSQAQTEVKKEQPKEVKKEEPKEAKKEDAAKDSSK